ELTARIFAAHASLPESSLRGGSSPESPRLKRLLRPWGSQHGSGELVRDGSALSLPFFLDLTLSLGARKPALRSHFCGYLSPRRLMLSAYEQTEYWIARFYLASLLGGAGIHAIYVWFVRELSMHSPPLRGQA
ncbi:hypothetical protein M9458_004683, partial [Cirrhinus mrigala]